MKIMTPKIFHGEKKKGRFTKDTIFFKDEVTLENIKKFYNTLRLDPSHYKYHMATSPSCRQEFIAYANYSTLVRCTT